MGLLTPDFRLLTARTVRRYIPGVLSRPVSGHSSWPPHSGSQWSLGNTVPGHTGSECQNRHWHANVSYQTARVFSYLPTWLLREDCKRGAIHPATLALCTDRVSSQVKACKSSVGQSRTATHLELHGQVHRAQMSPALCCQWAPPPRSG